jgi:hypothetical protein
LKAMIGLVNSQSTLPSLASGLQMAGVVGGVFTDRELVGRLEDEDTVETQMDGMNEFICQMKEAGMVAGPAPGLPVNPRFKDVQCYKCNRIGHLSRYCRWKEAFASCPAENAASEAPASGSGN